jgi:hypothetical protein
MRTEVREVFHKGASSIVEVRDEKGDVARYIFPSTELIEENNKFFVERIEEGQPYGVDWEDYIRTKMGPKAIANLLRKKGIWTLEDYAKNTAAVTSAFNEACSVNVQGFREAVLQQGKDEL